MNIIYKEIKEELKLKRSILIALERPIKDSPYTRNEGNIERKKEALKKEIEELKGKLESMNNIE